MVISDYQAVMPTLLWPQSTAKVIHWQNNQKSLTTIERDQDGLKLTSDNGTIDLNNLSYGLPGLTSQMGGALAQAAAVCLEDQEHTVGVSLSVSGDFTKSFAVHWPEVSDQTRRCYNDPEEATEWGACGVAILLVLALTDYTVIERSRKGTGL